MSKGPRKYGTGQMKTYAGKPIMTKEQVRLANKERARIKRLTNHEHTLNIALKSSRKKYPLPTRPCPSFCELCGRPPDIRVLVPDHDHETLTFRGWLCRHCNLSLGRFGDNAAGLKRALDYLTKGEDSATNR